MRSRWVFGETLHRLSASHPPHRAGTPSAGTQSPGELGQAGGVPCKKNQTSAPRELMTEEVRQSLQGETTNSTKRETAGKLAHSIWIQRVPSAPAFRESFVTSWEIMGRLDTEHQI